MIDILAESESKNKRVPDRIATLLLYLPLIAVTFAAKFALPFGAKQLPVPLLLLGAIMLFGLLSGRLRFDAPPLAFYLLTIATLCALQIIGQNEFSYLSLLLLAATFLPLVMKLAPDSVGPNQKLAAFQTIAAIMALCGILQYVGQYAIGPRLAFPIEHFTPESLLIRNYNFIIPLHYRGIYNKANGVFLLEPSFFSQLSALSLIVELMYFRRIARVLLLTVALAVAYSGTGLIILVVVLPPLLIIQRRGDLLLAVAGAAVLLAAAASALHLGIFIARLHNLNTVGSSGSSRFIAGFDLFDQFLWPDVKNALIGLGAGATVAMEQRANVPVAQMALTKIVLEYGVLGSMLYCGFLLFCFFRGKEKALLKIALVVCFFLNGALVPWVTAFAATLLAWPSSAPEPDHAPASASPSTVADPVRRVSAAR